MLSSFPRLYVALSFPLSSTWRWIHGLPILCYRPHCLFSTATRLLCGLNNSAHATLKRDLKRLRPFARAGRIAANGIPCCCSLRGMALAADLPWDGTAVGYRYSAHASTTRHRVATRVVRERQRTHTSLHLPSTHSRPHTPLKHVCTPRTHIQHLPCNACCRSRATALAPRDIAARLRAEHACL